MERKPSHGEAITSIKGVILMQLGKIGLGGMGANMVLRLLTGRHSCVVFDRSPKAI